MDEVASVLNSLEMVRWDRCVKREATADNPTRVTAYGWIDRDQDAYKDFVVIFFSDHRPIGYTTSSAKWSAEISRRLFGESQSAGHRECERIEDVFGDLVVNKTSRSKA